MKPSRAKPSRAKPSISGAKAAPAAKAKPDFPQQPKAAVEPAPRAAAEANATASGSPAMATRSGGSPSGVALALDRIVKLHRAGALTEQEFVAAKSRILGAAAAAENGSATFPAIEANVAAARRLADYTDGERESPTMSPDHSRGI